MLKAYNGSACDGCSCGGSEILDGTIAAFFLSLFDFDFEKLYKLAISASGRTHLGIFSGS